MIQPANNSSGNNSGGVGRPDNGQVLRVTVTLDGKHMADIPVTVTGADGSTSASGVTGKTGIYIATLDAGTYTVSASDSSASATSPVTIVESTDPVLVTLALAPAQAGSGVSSAA